MTARVEAERAITDVLAGHQSFGWFNCSCGLFMSDGLDHRAHLASVLADLMAERQAEAWGAGYRKGADDHYQCGEICKVPSEAPNPYRLDPKDTRDE